MKKVVITFDVYVLSFPPKVQLIMKKLRRIIRAAAPKAEESIAYGMPAYKLNGKPLVYFAGWSEHIGFYPTPAGTKQFSKQLSKYSPAKGSVRFPLDQPIPYDLIEKIVLFRVRQIQELNPPNKLYK